MERLTKRDGKFVHIDKETISRSDCPGEVGFHYCVNVTKCPQVSNRRCPVLRVFDRLAAYEDTGLTPEEIKHLQEERDCLQQSYDAMHLDLQKVTDLRKQEWISVKDRLPEQFVSVLVYMPDQAPMPTVREGYLTDCGFMVPALLQHIPVTHWAEMPKPPEEV